MNVHGFRKYTQYFRRKVVMGLAKTHTQTKIAEILGVGDFTVSNDVRAINKNAHKSHNIKLYT